MTHHFHPARMINEWVNMRKKVHVPGLYIIHFYSVTLIISPVTSTRGKAKKNVFLMKYSDHPAENIYQAVCYVQQSTQTTKGILRNIFILYFQDKSNTYFLRRKFCTRDIFQNSFQVARENSILNRINIFFSPNKLSLEEKNSTNQ